VAPSVSDSEHGLVAINIYDAIRPADLRARSRYELHRVGFRYSVTEQAANAIIRSADSILPICIAYPTKPAPPIWRPNVP
jgi:hypothetical protein